MGSVCRLIINRDFLARNNFRFEVGVPFMEDLLFCLIVLLKSSKVGINEGIFYHYIQNDNSAVSMYREDLLERQLEVFKALIRIIEDKDCFFDFNKRLANRYVNMFISIIVNEVSLENKKSKKGKIKFIRELCRDKKLKKILNSTDTSGFRKRRKIVLFALKNNLAMFLYLYYSVLSRILNK